MLGNGRGSSGPFSLEIPGEDPIAQRQLETRGQLQTDMVTFLEAQ